MQNRGLKVLLLVVGLCLISYALLVTNCSAQTTESLTITTYYPSPYGVYNEVQLYPHSTPVTTCNATTRGTIYYDSDDDQIYACNGTGWVGSSGGYWALSGTNLYPSNTSWNVGIGTTGPFFSTFDVNGSIRARQSLDIGPDGSTYAALSYSGGIFSLQNYNGAFYGNIRLNPSGGNVGIGTTTPQSKLDVAGNIKFTDQKACGLVAGGVWRYAIIVPSSWTNTTCDQYKINVGATNYWLGCIFENSSSVGSDGGGLPSPNCGW